MKPDITQVTIPGTNYQNGRSSIIDQITFHHIVGDASGAIARFQKYGEQVSSTYIIGSDGKIYQAVAEDDTPYTDANFASNSRAITIEHAGGIDSVPYTDAMYAASAQLVAWIRSRYNITRFMRHRDVSTVPTSCPGALDVERIIKASATAGDDDMVKPTEADVYGAFSQFANKPPENPEQVKYYMDRDIRDLYHDLMFYEVIPKSPEIEQAFKDLQPWAPMQPEQEAYYAQRPGEMLYRDIAIELKKKLDQTGQTQPPAGGYTEADRATATETNTIVKQIWGKISSVFK